MIDATSLRRALILTSALAACAAPTASGRVADAPVLGALAERAHDVGTSPNEHAPAVARDHHTRATPWDITFTNPLGRSRGPGAGAGWL